MDMGSYLTMLFWPNSKEVQMQRTRNLLSQGKSSLGQTGMCRWPVSPSMQALYATHLEKAFDLCGHMVMVMSRQNMMPSGW